MKLLHVSDWHLGRTTYGEPRAEDHDAVLQSLATPNPYAPASNQPMLIAWIAQPLLRVTVNGRPAQEANVNLLLVHLH